MARKMPPAGYYVYHNQLSGPSIDVVYTTGVRGGGGHCYYRVTAGQLPSSHFQNGKPKKFANGWTTLTWTCVPAADELKNHYTYYKTLPPGIPPF
jgi:hypothetical protein